jgi:hypothetical protein
MCMRACVHVCVCVCVCVCVFVSEEEREREKRESERRANGAKRAFKERFDSTVAGWWRVGDCECLYIADSH